jgi:hypothetical protein
MARCPGVPHSGHASTDWTCPLEAGDPVVRRIVDKLYATEPDPAELREQAVERAKSVLWLHGGPGYLDKDRRDRNGLVCKCGVRIPPRKLIGGSDVLYRDWDGWYRHVAEAVVEAVLP